MKKTILLGLIFLGLIGCASTMKSVTLKRATFDLNCPREKLKIQKLSSRTWGVHGCGKQATYLTEGECSIEAVCRAVLNSEKKQK